MKTNILLIGLLIVFFSRCSSPKYLPSSDKIDVNRYGSYININRTNGENINGELIAINNNTIIILTENFKKCFEVSISDVKHFKLRYAKPKHYGSSIPLFTLATIGHGWFLGLTAPINLLVTISVTASGENAFKYSDKNITYENLRMFTRFPQGLPPNIDLVNIK